MGMVREKPPKKLEKIVQPFVQSLTHLAFPNTVLSQGFRNVVHGMIHRNPEPEVIVDGHGQIFIESARLFQHVRSHYTCREGNEIIQQEFRGDASTDTLHWGYLVGVPLAVDDVDIAEDHRDLRELSEGFNLLGQLVGAPSIIRIAKGDEVAPSFGNPPVLGNRLTGVLLPNDSYPARRYIGLKNRGCLIGTAVIDHDRLEMTIILSQNAVQRLGEVVGHVVGCGNDRNQALFIHISHFPAWSNWEPEYNGSHFDMATR